jgi:type II secretory pathway component PulK
MSRRGFALMITLWVLVLLSVIAMHFSFSTRLGSAGTRNFKEDTLAYYNAISAYEEVLAYIISDPEPEVDFVDEENVFHTDTTRDPFESSLEDESTSVRVVITDEESKLNVNRLTRSTFIKLLEHTGVPDDSVHVIADSVEDWRDNDDLHHLSGAEDTYYAEFGYTAKDNQLDVPEELLLIRGFSPEHLYGDEDIMPLLPIITTWGNGVNINTASEDVLRVLGYSQFEIDEIVRTRSIRGPYTSPPAKTPVTSVTASSNIRIEVVASHKDSPLAVRITSVINRSLGTDEPVIKTLYWKEEFESSGT